MNHRLSESTKKDICYCTLCGSLSYKGKMSRTIPAKNVRNMNIDPLRLKFIPGSSTINYSTASHIKYIKSRVFGVNKIKSLVKNFCLKSMILFKSINFLNYIYFHNEDIPIENIEDVASTCVFLAIGFNECCIPNKDSDLTEDEYDIYYSPSDCNLLPKIDENKCLNRNSYDDNTNKKKEKSLSENNSSLCTQCSHESLHSQGSCTSSKMHSNLKGLYQYIKQNVKNFKYLEVVCLKSLNYNLGEYSAYDYLTLFFRLGFIFDDDKINIIEKFQNCIKALEIVINDPISCNYSQYIIAMSIIKINFLNEKSFDDEVFKYIYGVDFSKKKYISCIDQINNILLLYNNNCQSQPYNKGNKGIISEGVKQQNNNNIFIKNNQPMNFNQITPASSYNLNPYCLMPINSNIFFGNNFMQNITQATNFMGVPNSMNSISCLNNVNNFVLGNVNNINILDNANQNFSNQTNHLYKNNFNQYNENNNYQLDNDAFLQTNYIANNYSSGL